MTSYAIENGGFWKTDHDFLLVVNWHFLPIWLRFRVTNILRLTWKIPISGKIFRVFPTLRPQKWFGIILTPKRHILAWKHAFWYIDRLASLSRATCSRSEQSRNKKKKKVRICEYISPCAHGSTLRGRTMGLGTVGGLDDVINRMKF